MPRYAARRQSRFTDAIAIAIASAVDARRVILLALRTLDRARLSELRQIGGGEAEFAVDVGVVLSE